MKKIASFCVNHDKLLPGIYLSRVDGDVVTYDIRLVRPNCPPYLPNPVLHTIEHLFATFARNSAFSDHVIYFGPMGCRTGFYFLVSGMEHQDVIALIQDIFRRISVFSEPVPGAACSAECGNYLEHDLPGAREWAAAFVPVIAAWTPEKLRYEE
ncbi:MAG: S-ribosylhomocysteine lyase [Clostridiales bacterium]|jgi:S-ribosylhomocysteine lyase|nr:S-ribosylhomocysteine lyase [Clostridiales bacterium]